MFGYLNTLLELVMQLSRAHYTLGAMMVLGKDWQRPDLPNNSKLEMNVGMNSLRCPRDYCNSKTLI